MSDNTPDPAPLPPQGPSQNPPQNPPQGAPHEASQNAPRSLPPLDGSRSEVLETSPFKDDLDKELADRGPGARSPNGPTLYLVAAVLLVAGFLGGIFTHKAMAGGGSGSSGDRAAGGPGGRGFGGGYGGYGGGFRNGGSPGGGGAPGGGAPGGGGMTAGTVTKVVGDTLYLKTSDGRTVTVKTNGSTRIQITRTGTVKDLKNGTMLIVRGTSGSDGSMTATSVNEGAGFGGLGRRGPNGGGGPSGGGGQDGGGDGGGPGGGQPPQGD
ncbi:hypothetical protein AB0J52_35400 [Spirillospora sp. NPDC049652]